VPFPTTDGVVPLSARWPLPRIARPEPPSVSASPAKRVDVPVELNAMKGLIKRSDCAAALVETMAKSATGAPAALRIDRNTGRLLGWGGPEGRIPLPLDR